VLKPPFNLSGFEPRMDPVPALGEHTAAILGELGYANAEIDALRRQAPLAAALAAGHPGVELAVAVDPAAHVVGLGGLHPGAALVLVNVRLGLQA